MEISLFARERSRTDFTTKSTKGHEGWNLFARERSRTERRRTSGCSGRPFLPPLFCIDLLGLSVRIT